MYAKNQSSKFLKYIENTLIYTNERYKKQEIYILYIFLLILFSASSLGKESGLLCAHQTPHVLLSILHLLRNTKKYHTNVIILDCTHEAVVSPYIYSNKMLPMQRKPNAATFIQTLSTFFVLSTNRDKLFSIRKNATFTHLSNDMVHSFSE